MTPLPKRRWSTQRQGKRRSTIKPFSETTGKCSECGAIKPAHQACPVCGFYRGRQVLKGQTPQPDSNSEGKKVENEN